MEKRPIPARAVLIVLAALLLAGCTPSPRQTRTPPSDPEPPPPPKAERVSEEKPAAEPEPADLVHTVRWNGESLSVIAKWYTGEAENWRLLAKHNLLNDPDRIDIGDPISIPEPLLRTREPLPREFVRRHAPPPPKTGPPDEPGPAGAAPEPSPEEDPELFGPKELKSD
jgi:hypothetical protein